MSITEFCLWELLAVALLFGIPGTVLLIKDKRPALCGALLGWFIGSVIVIVANWFIYSP